MTYLEKIEHIHGKLLGMNDTEALVFCVIISSRLIPNYEFFNYESGFGKAEVLTDAIEFVLEDTNSFLEKNNTQLLIHLEKVEEQTPETDQFSFLSVSFALDSCVSILETLEFVKDRNFQHVLAVSVASTDTVHAFIQENYSIEYEDPDYDSKILTNSLMKNEIAFQEYLIGALKGSVDPVGMIPRIKKSIEMSKSNIGL